MGNLEDEVVVSSYAAGQPKVHLGAPSGRKFRLGDLLYSLMLESHNDSAVMLAALMVFPHPLPPPSQGQQKIELTK